MNDSVYFHEDQYNGVSMKGGDPNALCSPKDEQAGQVKPFNRMSTDELIASHKKFIRYCESKYLHDLRLDRERDFKEEHDVSDEEFVTDHWQVLFHIQYPECDEKLDWTINQAVSWKTKQIV